MTSRYTFRLADHTRAALGSGWTPLRGLWVVDFAATLG